MGDDEFKRAIIEAEKYFTSSPILGKINLQAVETLAWMRSNKASYGPEGYLQQCTPWWINPPETNCPIIKETRQRVLRDRAYEHGFQHFVHGLMEKSVLYAPDPNKMFGVLVRSEKMFKVLVDDATTAGVLNQLVARFFTESARGGVSLKDLSKLYGHGPDTKPARIRDSKVKHLFPVGVLTVTCNKNKYDISLGPVARAFWVDVYLTIVNETFINYKEPKHEDSINRLACINT